MKQIKLTFSLLLLFTGSIFAQDSLFIKPTKISYLDSIKKTFVKYDIATKVDSLWVKELNNNDLYADITNDIETIDLNQDVDFELPTDLLKARLAEMDAKSPFNIEYNPGLENLIKSFLKNRRKSFERLMGLSEYYFPLFEDAFSKQNIPLEIKYLAIVESALNPKAVSRVGATGLWQFMYQTGKEYKLNIDSYVDERSDPLKASAAASQYMANMYAIFGDWDLVLAAYNSGAGNVSKAIRRSGGQKNFWNIKKHLPKETQGYVPAFLATMYIYEFHKEHGIVPKRAEVKHFETDTIQIKQQISFKQISELLDISESQLQLFNPSYKLKVVPNYKNKPHYLRLPLDKIAVFTANEDKIYAYVQHELNQKEMPFANSQTAIADSDIEAEQHFKNIQKTKYYKVKRGDNLSEIADKFNVSMSQIKKWNHLRSNTVSRGKTLKIIDTDRIAIKSKKQSDSKNNDIATLEDVAEISETKKDVVDKTKEIASYKWEKIAVNKEVTKTHKIKRGENLGKIANNYNVSITELKKWNKLKNNNVVVGKELKIITTERVVTNIKKPIQSDKIEDLEKSSNYYTVQKGDNLLSIAKRNNVTVEELREWNHLDDNTVQLESKLKVVDIVKNGITDEVKNETSNIEHTVQKGEFLGQIAKKYDVTLEELKEWNNKNDNSVVAGEKLIVGKKQNIENNQKHAITQKQVNEYKTATQKEQVYQVKRGDSLFSIAQKYPGITVSDLKKWNGIRGNELKPGMKLKISG